jgi:hypothetical protein
MTPAEQIVAVARDPVALSCSRFKDVEGFPGCCGSCHGDDEEFGTEMCHARIPVDGKDVEADVCCTVATWIKQTLGQPT